MKKGLFVILFIAIAFRSYGQENNDNIIINIRFNDIKSDSSLFTTRIYSQTLDDANRQFHKPLYINNAEAKWIIKSKEPLAVISKLLPRSAFVEPGDSIVVNFLDQTNKYSGKGSEKWYLLEKFMDLDKSNFAQGYKSLPIKSIQEYLDYFYYIEQKLIKRDSILKNVKKMLSKQAYDFIEDRILIVPTSDVSLKFNTVIKLFTDSSKRDTSKLNEIYDGTIKKSIAMQLWKDDLNNPPSIYSSPLIQRLYDDFSRSENFDLEIQRESRAESLPKLLKFINKNYTGRLRERLYSTELLYNIGKLGVNDLTIILKDEYLKSPGFPEFKQFFVREFEKFKAIKKGQALGEYALTDVNGKKYQLSSLLGKVVLLDFWFTGCKGCVQLKPALQNVQEYFKDNTRVQFVSISVDESRNQWLASLIKRKYSIEGALDLNTGKEDLSRSLVKRLNLSSYPKLVLIDPQGKIAVDEVPDPRSNPQQLIAAISNALIIQIDGPYIFYKNENAIVKSINLFENKVTNFDLNAKTVLTSYSDSLGVEIPLKLKQRIENEPDNFEMNSNKIIVVSDIEGNFSAFRKLLMANKVIDKDYNWLFGDGHLVLLGDFVDRGNQVTECLWLIYGLEQKAKEQDGYVHFIMGNHEIMNLNGQNPYTREKYKNVMNLLGYRSTMELYDKNTELGRWLRSKNTIERIGNNLFVHGGISPEILSLNLGLSDINRLTRLYYDKSDEATNSKDSIVHLLHHDRLSPTWYRSYYVESKSVQYEDGRLLYIPKATDNLLNRTLNVFNVIHVVTGHSIVGDTISTHFGNKVINVDTHHAEGKSEALLIEGNNFYRVNAEGKRVLLFRDDEK